MPLRRHVFCFQAVGVVGARKDERVKIEIEAEGGKAYNGGIRRRG
jgi:hypothetical protein